MEYYFESATKTSSSYYDNSGAAYTPFQIINTFSSGPSDSTLIQIQEPINTSNPDLYNLPLDL